MDKKEEVYVQQRWRTKGESVEHPEERNLTENERTLRKNPYKTPPNNITSKRPAQEEKG